MTLVEDCTGNGRLERIEQVEASSALSRSRQWHDTAARVRDSCETFLFPFLEGLRILAPTPDTETGAPGAPGPQGPAGATGPAGGSGLCALSGALRLP